MIIYYRRDRNKGGSERSNLKNKIGNDGDGEEPGDRGIALKETDTTVDAAVSWMWGGDDELPSYGVFAAHFDLATADLEVDFAFSYGENEDFEHNSRTLVSGNSSDHEFEIQRINNGRMALVGKGVSQGDGYMLFKYKMLYTVDGVYPDANYLVIPAAEATIQGETWFEDQFNAGDASEYIYSDPANLPDTVAAYKDWVGETEFLTSDDVMTDINTLNAGNPNQGTIALYY